MITEGIEKSRLFQGMTADELSSCLDSLDAQEKKYRKDEIILRSGEQTSNIGMVLSGSVTIESNDVWGNCTVLSHVGKYQYFAETYALLGEVLLVDVRANEDCAILFCNIKNLLDNNKKSSPWKEKAPQKHTYHLIAEKPCSLRPQLPHFSQKLPWTSPVISQRNCAPERLQGI